MVVGINYIVSCLWLLKLKSLFLFLCSEKRAGCGCSEENSRNFLSNRQCGGIVVVEIWLWSLSFFLMFVVRKKSSEKLRVYIEANWRDFGGVMEINVVSGGGT